MERIYQVDVLNDYLIKVTFFNGDVKEVDLDKYLSPNDNMLDEDCARCREQVEEYQSINGNTPLTYGAKVNESRNAVDFTCGMSINAETLWYCGYLVEQVYIYDIRVRLAETVVRIRENLHMTQSQLAKITGIHQAEISKLERGVGNPSVETIKKVAAGLGCDVTISFEHLSNIEFPPERVRQYLKILKRQGDYTIHDIDELPEDARCELTNGYVYDMGMPSIIHQQIIFEIASSLRDYIKRRRGECMVIQSPFALKFEDDNSNLLSPDLVVVCDRDKVNAKEVCGAPDFVLEVVSPNNVKRDYSEKKDIYRNKGVKEYWILDPIKRRLVVHLFDQDEIPTIYGLDSIVGVNIFDNNLTIDLSEIEDIIAQLD